jgi:hypothetical protein
MIKMFMLIVAVTLPDGAIKLDVRDAKNKCPTIAEVVPELQELAAAGYIKHWQFFCREVYIMVSAGKTA